MIAINLKVYIPITALPKKRIINPIAVNTRGKSFRNSDDAWRPFSTFQGFVRLVLLVDWDPIGILGYANAMDEYDNYALHICKLILEGATRDDLVSHLDQLERQRMGLPGGREAQTQVAEKLLKIYVTLQRQERSL